MKNKNMFLMGAIALIVIVAFGVISIYALPGQTGQKTADSPQSLASRNSNEVQKATLSFENYEYILTPNTLKKGVPAEITVDLNTVYGCMRDVTIREFDVRKYVSEGDNVIKFTPDKEGTFLIACSMNMGRGYFSVSSDGTASGLAASKTLSTSGSTAGASVSGSGAVPAGTCGMAAGGGCGCGRN